MYELLLIFDFDTNKVISVLLPNIETLFFCLEVKMEFEQLSEAVTGVCRRMVEA